ncbi:SDR family NAD(P)-dependent oxidoreductase, partial [candidate division KSB3 bacterium]|nr:SDR family NAD(P)-dependent oxidoreductase [candidate division KSB3 bacterium]MBD3326468.1 SDR family NAD(P)-dependent oxidoreductase [candidate division KSB3 bacterium]
NNMPPGNTTTPAPQLALITGASSGIGAAFARDLAARGSHLILVARRRERLESLADQLRTTHHVNVEVLPADLAQEAGMSRVEERISTSDPLDLLINNAGFGTPGAFAQIPLTKTTQMLTLHVMASTRLTWHALQKMLPRNHGSIINVSSIAAFLLYPTAVSYCSTKVYLNVFSEALQNQLRDTQITIQSLCPGFTHTEFHATEAYQASFDHSRIPAWMWMTADEVVNQSLRALEKQQVIVIPGLKNRLLVKLMTAPITSQLLKPIMAKAVNARKKSGSPPSSKS